MNLKSTVLSFHLRSVSIYHRARAVLCGFSSRLVNLTGVIAEKLYSLLKHHCINRDINLI